MSEHGGEGAAPVFVALTAGGADLARRLAGAHGRVDVFRQDFDDATGHMAEVFLSGRPLVAVASAGIVVRALAPWLSDKRGEAPVVAVAEDGSAVVPLLGGHRGANALAARLAGALGVAPSITTAGEARLGVALDAPPAGWRLDNPEDAKPAMAALLAGRPARIAGGAAAWLAPLDAERAPGEGPTVLSVAGAEPLVYRRQRLALGVGCARGCDPGELEGLVRKTLADAGIAAGEIAAVHSIDVKADEAAVHALANALGVPARFHDAATLEAEAPRLENPSEVVFAEVGCHGVAEGAALAAAGPGGRLVVPKRRSAAATCAVAETAPGGAPGRPRGSLSVVGIGPGQAAWRTPEAMRAIAGADLLVGYGLYLDLLGPLGRGIERRAFPLGAEEERCRFALEAAGEGRRVALVSSGDGGIYAMGALVMELLDRGGLSPAAQRVEVVHVPGISALQAASARTGALLGHDFCTVSLSDLLTPREDILRRLQAAAAGDFVVALYNPVSQRRRELLDRARDILAEARGPDAPVILAGNLGRPDERLRYRTLGGLRTEEVDMLTVVLVGSSQSRAFRGGDISAGAEGWQVYTPRGYGKKGVTR